MSILEQLPEVPLPWSRHDIEQRFGFRGGRFTSVNIWFTCVLGVLASIIFYASLLLIKDHFIEISFTKRGITPYFTVWFSFWAMMILIVKSSKLRYQILTLNYGVLPNDPQFVLSSANVNVVVKNIHNVVDDPKHFVLFNRIMITLSNLRNLGQVNDVDGILRSQADNDESSMETSYLFIGALIWAIPVLGFIGTVLGLSDAIGQFSTVLQGEGADLSAIKGSLQNVTGGLATAFETTLQALVAALLIQLWLTLVKQSEEIFLDACNDYCLKNIVNRLRIMPYQ